MKKFTKKFIGKGTAVAGMDIVKVSFPFANLESLTHEFEGVKYLTFELAKMKAKDDYGRTHTAYVSVREEENEEDAAPAKPAATDKKGKGKKQAEPVMETSDQDLPF